MAASAARPPRAAIHRSWRRSTPRSAHERSTRAGLSRALVGAASRSHRANASEDVATPAEGGLRRRAGSGPPARPADEYETVGRQAAVRASPFEIGPRHDTRVTGCRQRAMARDPHQPNLRASRERIHWKHTSVRSARHEPCDVPRRTCVGHRRRGRANDPAGRADRDDADTRAVFTRCRNSAGLAVLRRLASRTTRNVPVTWYRL